METTLQQDAHSLIERLINEQGRGNNPDQVHANQLALDYARLCYFELIFAAGQTPGPAEPQGE